MNEKELKHLMEFAKEFSYEISIPTNEDLEIDFVMINSKTKIVQFGSLNIDEEI